MSRLHIGSMLMLCLMLGPAWTAEEPPRRTDAFGDPLPDGAVARLGTVRWRSRIVLKMTFSRDGKLAVTGASDSTVRIWDSAGREIRKFADFHGEVTHVALSPDDKTLAAVCSDDVLRLWDAPTGKLLHEVEKPYGGKWRWDRLDVLVFSPDGKNLMLGHGASIRCFDADSGKEAALPAPPEKGMAIDAVSEDGSTAVSAGQEGEFVVWDLATAKILGRVAGHGGKGPIALSPDRQRLAAAWKDDNPIVQVWDLATGKKLGQCKGCQDEVCSLCFSPDGKSVASGACDLTARLWNAETGEERWRFHATGACIYSVEVRFAPDGKSVAAAGWDGVVRLIDADSGKERGDPNEQRTVIASTAFTADGKRVVMGCEDHSVRLWDAATGKEIRRLKGPAIVLYSAEQHKALHPKDCVDAVACSSDGMTIAAATGTGVLVWDKDAKNPRSLEGASQSLNLAFSPDGALLATGNRAVHLWDPTTGKEQTPQNDEPLNVSSVCFSPDGRILAAGCYGGTLRLLNLGDGRSIAKIKAHDHDAVFSISFSPDGKTLATSGMDWTVRMWEVVSGKERERFAGKRSMMDHVAYSPDGRFLAFGGTDNVIHIYDLTAGKEIHEFLGHEGWITSVAFSPDGTRFVSGSQDCTALVWDMTTVRLADQPKEADLPAKERDALWDRLAGDDAVEAGRAIRALLAAPRQAAALLRERLRPDSAPQADRIAAFIRDLDSDDFDVRERASDRLRQLGEAAAPALRIALEGNPSAEVRQRAHALLASLDKGGPPPEVLRSSRALEVLERLATPQAEEILKTLAGGNEHALLTRDSAAALERLKKRPSVP